jgi:hypothetical protein
VLSSKASITISWTLNSDGGSSVLGYYVYQNNVTTGGESLIYDGSKVPTVTSYKVTGLIPGNVYKFRVSALNRVGEGA